jgi:hypothetical protein
MLVTPRLFVIIFDILKFGRTWTFIPSNIPQLTLTTLSYCERSLCRIFLLTDRSKQILTKLFLIINRFGEILFLYVVYNLWSISPCASFVIILKRDVDRTLVSVPNNARYGHLFLFTLRREDLFLSNWKKLCPLRVIAIFHLPNLGQVLQLAKRRILLILLNSLQSSCSSFITLNQQSHFHHQYVKWTDHQKLYTWLIF